MIRRGTFARSPLVLAVMLAAASAVADPPAPPVTDGHGVMQRLPPENGGLVLSPATPSVIAPHDGLIKRHGHWMTGHRRATRAEIELHLKREMINRPI